MPSPIPFQGSSEAPLEVSAISASLHDSFGADTAAQRAGMAEAASQGWEWKYAATSSGAGWSETGQWSHEAGTWSQADWQRHRTRDQWIESSAQPSQQAGWGPELWRSAQYGRDPYSSAQTCQWHQARQTIPAQEAKAWPPKSGGKCDMQGPPKATMKAGPQAEPGYQSAQPMGSQKCRPGNNFNMAPYFQELPPGSPSYRLTQRLKELGLPRDPATWKKWQSLYFPDFHPPRGVDSSLGRDRLRYRLLQGV